MYNIRIKQLPKNGDQRNYSLVDRNDLYIKVNPINSNTNVKNTIGAVPRDEANIEAEGGETVIGDINNDGFLEHNKIVGKRHSEGGVPLNVAPGSFIFSDTRKLKIKDPEVLSIFGINKMPKGGITPAKIAERYPMNNYMNTLKDNSADPVAKRTATQMMKNNLEKLGMLALVQESMKGFPDGIPAIAQSVMAGMQLPQMMEGEETAEQENEMRYGGGYYQRAGTTKEKQKATIPASGTFYINGKPNLITKKYEGFFGDEWVQFKNPIQVIDEDGDLDEMYEMTVDDWQKLTKNKSLKMGYEDSLIAPSHYTDITNLDWWNQDRTLNDVGRGVKYNTITYSTTPGTPAKSQVRKELQPGYTFKQGNKTYKVVASDVYSTYGTDKFGNREAVSVQQIDDPDRNFTSYFDTKFGKKLIPKSEYLQMFSGSNALSGNENQFVPSAGSMTTNPYANIGNNQNMVAIDTSRTDNERAETVVIKEDNSNTSKPSNVVTSNSGVTKNSSNRPRTKKVAAPIETSRFTVQNGKYQGQQAFAVKRGDTIRINYSDGNTETYINGKLVTEYKYGGDLPKHQGTEPGVSSTVGQSSLDEEAINAIATGNAAGQIYTGPSQVAAGVTNQGIQSGAVQSMPAGDPNKQVIANSAQDFEIKPSSVATLPYTPKSKSTYAPWKPENYDTQWKPMAEQAMSTLEGAKAIDDYLTNVAAKGKYGPNVLYKLQGLTGQARYDKILELATDGDPGIFHNAFLEAITVPKKEKEQIVVTKKQAFICKQDPATGESNVVTVEYEGDTIPAGHYSTYAQAEASCIKSPKNIITQTIPQKRRRPWWIQDTINYAGAMTDMIDKYGPAMSQVDFETPGYVLENPDRSIAELKESAAANREALLNTTAGNVGTASQTGFDTKTLGAAANIIGNISNRNVNTVNQSIARNAQINNQERLTNEELKQKYIAESALANQNYDNARRDLKWRQIQAFNQGTTNWMRHKQMEDVLFPNVGIDSITGDVYFPGGRQMYNEKGNYVYDPYINPMLSKNTTYNPALINKYYLENLKLKDMTPAVAYQMAKDQVTGTMSDPSNASYLQAVNAGMTLPQEFQKYGGKIKKQYGGVIFDFGALPLYFFED
jgi:hypothetical protein